MILHDTRSPHQHGCWRRTLVAPATDFLAGRVQLASTMLAKPYTGGQATEVEEGRARGPFVPAYESPPSWNQRRLAACVLVILIGTLMATAPFARIPLKNTEVLLPAYAAAVFVDELITAASALSSNGSWPSWRSEFRPSSSPAMAMFQCL